MEKTKYLKKTTADLIKYFKVDNMFGQNKS